MNTACLLSFFSHQSGSWPFFNLFFSSFVHTYFFAYFYHPFKEDETEQSTEVQIIFPAETKPVFCEFDWELDELDEFTDKLIEDEQLDEDQKDAFKKFVKEKVREAKKANREVFEQVEGRAARGQVRMAPPQLVHPERFQPPEPSELELRREEERRQEREHYEKLEEVRILRTRSAENMRYLCQEDQLRQVNAAISAMWTALMRRKVLSSRDVPADLVPGSSSQGGGPRQPSPPRANSYIHPDEFDDDYRPDLLMETSQPQSTLPMLLALESYFSSRKAMDAYMLDLIQKNPPPRSDDPDDLPPH